MAEMDYPARNRVRKSWFDFLDNALAEMNRPAPINGIYLPGEGDLEAPFYRKRKITPFGIERVEKIAKKLSKSRRVFTGSLQEYVEYHIALQRRRLDFAAFDCQGKLYGITPELLSLFSIFPGTHGGALWVTMFVGCDGESLKRSLVALHLLNSALPEGAVPDSLTHLRTQWRIFTKAFGDIKKSPRSVVHQVARDAGFLWNLCLGMGAVTMPYMGYGNVREPIFEQITRQTVLSNEHINGSWKLNPSLDVCVETRMPGMRRIAESVQVPLIPAKLQRIVYRSAAGRRMVAWFVFWKRAAQTRPWATAIQELWQLYTQSSLLFMDANGKLFLL